MRLFRTPGMLAASASATARWCASATKCRTGRSRLCMVAHPVDEDVAMSGDAYVSPGRWAAARWGQRYARGLRFAAYACGCTARPSVPVLVPSKTNEITAASTPNNVTQASQSRSAASVPWSSPIAPNRCSWTSTSTAHMQDAGRTRLYGSREKHLRTLRPRSCKAHGDGETRAVPAPKCGVDGTDGVQGPPRQCSMR